MSEHCVLDCRDKEIAMLRAYADSHKEQRAMMEGLSFKNEGLPADEIDYLARKIEVLLSMSLARFEYLVGLIWEVEQRRKSEESTND